MLLYMTSKIHHFVSVHVDSNSKKKGFTKENQEKKNIKWTAWVSIIIMQYNTI